MSDVFLPNLQPAALNVPYHSQLEEGALRYRNDCGAACGAMLLEALTGERQTVDEFYRLTGAGGDRYLAAGELMRVLGARRAPCAWREGLTAGDLLEALSARKPAICLVSYAVLREAGLTESSFGGPHFLLAVGMDVLRVSVHDPLYRGQGGRFKTYPLAVFLRAWEAAGKDGSGNPSCGALIPHYGLGDALPPVKRVRVWAENGLNIRRGPGKHYERLAALRCGETAGVEEERSGWGKLAGLPGWICLEFVNEEP